jgi:hypothetical protein
MWIIVGYKIWRGPMYITCPSNTTTFLKVRMIIIIIIIIIIIMGRHISNNANIGTIVLFSPAL